jgi:hypothetical protein
MGNNIPRIIFQILWLRKYMSTITSANPSDDYQDASHYYVNPATHILILHHNTRVELRPGGPSARTSWFPSANQCAREQLILVRAHGRLPAVAWSDWLATSSCFYRSSDYCGKPPCLLEITFLLFLEVVRIRNVEHPLYSDSGSFENRPQRADGPSALRP